MDIVFTICSNNYLAQATVLGNSVKVHLSNATFVIVLVDALSELIDYTRIPFEVLPAAKIEPRLEELSRRYDIVELNTSLKPRAMEYLLSERMAKSVTYLDPDIRLYSSLPDLDDALKNSNIVLTPHVLTPVPMDGKGPAENRFLRFGVYNLGFIAANKTEETLRMLAWWKGRTYAMGYNRAESGVFVDQLCVNLVPIFFDGVVILRHEGYNMAPWNLHERRLSRENGVYWVAPAKRLAFFHFSSFRIDSGELPIAGYSRFAMKDRPDLVELYGEYNEELKTAGASRYVAIPWAYAEAGRGSGLRWRWSKRKTLSRQVLAWGIRRLPVPARETLCKMLIDSGLRKWI